MAKIAFDKYYTPPTVARWCIDKTYEIIGKDNITEIVEPSAGCGMFSHQIPGCKAYDLYPQHEYIEQADFLKLDLGGYKKGRLFIGNPPFGAGTGKLLKDFYDKSCDNGDYIAFIQPSSYCNSYKTFYRFEIVYSCLIKTEYTNTELYTSFTIYKRNEHRDDYKEEKVEQLKDVTLTKIGRSNKSKKYNNNLEYDYCFTTFGQILTESIPYKTAGQMIVKCNNPDNKEQIITFLKWLYYYNKETRILSKKHISVDNVSIYDLIKLLTICIPNIK